MPAPRPRPKAPSAPADPNYWGRVGQAMWETNLAAPIRAVHGLLNADPHTLYTDEGEAGQQAAADSFDVAGSVTAGSAFTPKPSNSLNMGIKAYHGSPHSFDRFDFSKMGTGEGRQAYGKGGYFADNEGTARGYRDTLKPGAGIGPEHTASRVLDGFDGDVDAAIAHLRETAQKAVERGAPYEDVRTLMDARNVLISEPERARGSMYEVDINADLEHFINYDAPLAEQSPYIRDALKKHYGFTYDSKEQQGWIGGEVVNNSAMTREHAKELNDHGIAGVRYLDGVSRKDGVENKSYNYVVFDDKLVSILKKYGLAGLLGSSAAMEAANQSDGEY